MVQPKTIGIIGLGSAGMRHAKNLLAMGHTVWGYDPNSSALVLFNELGGKPLAKMWGNERTFDGIVIASPTKSHLGHLKTTTHWKRPVLVEKPIADEVDWDIDLRQVMVGCNLRFHACVKKAKEWIKGGSIGDLICGSFTVFQFNDKYTESCILNWGAHECDLALYFLGPATVTGATGSHDWANILCLHEYGVPSIIHCEYRTPIERRVFSIMGTKGNIDVDLVRRDSYLSRGGDGDQIFKADDSFDENYKDEMQAFIDLIDGKPVPHAATGQDGLNCLELILEAKKMAGIA